MSTTDDPIAVFYRRHPYPPPVVDLQTYAERFGDGREARLAHHLVWPRRPYGDVRTVLVAGCGTSQAARHALLHPDRHVIGIDVSETSIEHTRRLVDLHSIGNLEVHHLPIEDVDRLGQHFDHVVCTGVLHHLADPAVGLGALRRVLAPGGAMTLMVYARHGRAGLYMMQEYCRRLGLEASADDLAELAATLRELPAGHPFDHTLRRSRDIADDDALADALLNPRDRAYTVPELFELLAGADLRFARWLRQAPYLPQCGSISETPHRGRVARLPAVDQYAAVELFRGTIARHTLIAVAGSDPAAPLDFSDPDVDRWVPHRASTAIAVEDRLPPGAAAALINQAHTDTDLVCFADRAELRTFRSIDGVRTVGSLGRRARDFVERLWHHDLVVLDASAGTQDDDR